MKRAFAILGAALIVAGCSSGVASEGTYVVEGDEPVISPAAPV